MKVTFILVWLSLYLESSQVERKPQSCRNPCLIFSSKFSRRVRGKMINCEGKTSKYFNNKEVATTSAISRKQIDGHDDEATLEYDLEENQVQLAAAYTKEDFLTDSGEDDAEYNEMELQEDQSSSYSSIGAFPKNKNLEQTTLNSFYGKVATGSKNNEGKERKYKPRRWNDDDTENYRNGYPGQKDDLSLNDNLHFYTGRIPSYPDGDFIDTIHRDWFGNYRLLERHHGYIQWIFPIREDGMNWKAQALQLHEAKAIQASRVAKKRVLTSFKLMLDFYGMQLDDEVKGRFSRSRNWQKQLANLNWSSHNFLRITRILKSLGELGYEHLKKPFLLFLMEEALIEKTLPKVVKSCQDYWIGTIKNDVDREELYNILSDNDA